MLWLMLLVLWSDSGLVREALVEAGIVECETDFECEVLVGGGE